MSYADLARRYFCGVLRLLTPPDFCFADVKNRSIDAIQARRVVAYHHPRLIFRDVDKILAYPFH